MYFFLVVPVFLFYFFLSLFCIGPPQTTWMVGEKIVLWVATVPDTDGCEKVCKKKEVEDLNVVKKRKK